jgi:hypothetical protein
MKLKNISKHRPSNLIIDVAEEDAKEILKTNEFIEATKEKLIVEKKLDEESISEEKPIKKIKL